MTSGMNILSQGLFIATSIMLSSCDWGEFESVLITPHYSIFYDRNFADRFSLPKDKSVDLGNNYLKAVAIGIQKVNGSYTCDIHIYYDTSIKLYTPNKQDVFLNRQHQEYFFAREMNDSDYKYSDKQSLENTGRAYFRSKSLKTIKTGTSSTVGYSSYKKDFLPGLNMASFNIGCSFLDAEHGAAELWVQKEGLVDYKLINEDPLNIKNKESNYRFDVPLGLLQTVKPMIDRINKLSIDQSSSAVSLQFGEKE
ncbi:MAG: hypothetical protein OEY51_14940 [Cyclobacteriaceae bacterium]|nr:hypothetical protein [Cyclobacteriaceae bacterium]